MKPFNASCQESESDSHVDRSVQKKTSRALSWFVAYPPPSGSYHPGPPADGGDWTLYYACIMKHVADQNVTLMLNATAGEQLKIVHSSTCANNTCLCDSSVIEGKNAFPLWLRQRTGLEWGSLTSSSSCCIGNPFLQQNHVVKQTFLSERKLAHGECAMFVCTANYSRSGIKILEDRDICNNIPVTPSTGVLIDPFPQQELTWSFMFSAELNAS